MPGFREACLAYSAALEKLAVSLVPLYALALDLPETYFDEAFARPMFKLRMTHYPPQEAVDNEFGLAPHTDTSFMTLLAPNKVPGLSIRLPSGRWIDAPPIEGAFLVNGGDMLRRWTNDRFLATPHRVINRTGAERYAIPFFFDCWAEHLMTCLPTCTNPGNPPQIRAHHLRRVHDLVPQHELRRSRGEGCPGRSARSQLRGALAVEPHCTAGAGRKTSLVFSPSCFRTGTDP